MPKSPTRCSNLKEELRLLRDEMSNSKRPSSVRTSTAPLEAATGPTPSIAPRGNAGPGDVSSGVATSTGMSRWATSSSSMFDDVDDSNSASTAQCTPEKKANKRTQSDCPTIPPSVLQNRFHMISDEGCEGLKQSGLKKAARSPTALGQPPPTEASSASNHAKHQQKFGHLLIIDFECTCDSGEPNYPHEIIEFPVVVVDTRCGRVVAEFHSYVRPVRNPQLTVFCTELTGITQEMVADAPTLPEVLRLFDEWVREVLVPLISDGRRALKEATLLDVAGPILFDEVRTSPVEEQERLYQSIMGGGAPPSSASSPPVVMIVTDGPTDMRHFMYNCHVIRDAIEFPPLFYRWLNVRRAFADHFRVKPEQLTKMLRRLGMQFHGQHHSGIDDARNIARVVIALMQRGHRLQHVSSIPFQTECQLVAQRQASDLLMELGDDCDVGAARGHRGSDGGKHGGGRGGRGVQKKKNGAK